MAINPNTNVTMSGRITAVDANYPFASAKDESSPGAGDGTPYFKARADDIFGMQQALLELASIVPTGNADTAIASQYVQAMLELAAGRATAYDESGAADVYVLDVRTKQQTPPAYFDGMVVVFDPANTNTGASTVDVGALGVINIKLPGGAIDPSAGQILAGRSTKLIHRTAPSAHFELDQSGITNIVTFTTSGTYTPPAGIRSIKFTTIGAGGGAGGVDGQGVGTTAASVPGAGGGAVLKRVVLIDSSYTITIGAGGAGGAAGNNPGSNGGTTTVGSASITLTAGGGSGGTGSIGTSGNTVFSGVIGGTASGGDLNLEGGDTPGAGVAGGDPVGLPNSGASILGGTTRGVNGANGDNALVEGAGGGAVATLDVATNFSGGNGAGGIVIVEEFF